MYFESSLEYFIEEIKKTQNPDFYIFKLAEIIDDDDFIYTLKKYILSTNDTSKILSILQLASNKFLSKIYNNEESHIQKYENLLYTAFQHFLNLQPSNEAISAFKDLYLTEQSFDIFITSIENKYSLEFIVSVLTSSKNRGVIDEYIDKNFSTLYSSKKLSISQIRNILNSISNIKVFNKFFSMILENETKTTSDFITLLLSCSRNTHELEKRVAVFKNHLLYLKVLNPSNSDLKLLFSNLPQLESTYNSKILSLKNWIKNCKSFLIKSK